MSDLGRVIVLAGGLSYERDVSERSGRRVAEALRDLGVDTVVLDADASLLPRLTADGPAAVFVALHGAPGEDGAIRAVLDLAGIAYVGAGPAACRAAWDKPAAKALIGAAGVATPASVVLPQTTFRELGAAVVLDLVLAELGLPLIVKPACGGSALGVTVVREPERLAAAMVACFSYGPVALLEEYVAGTEIAVSVLDLGTGPVALPAVEVVPDSGLFDYEARYTAGQTAYYVPARLDPAVAERAARAAVTAHTVLGLRDLSRADFVVDASGEPQFLEVNVSPGMTETSLFPMAALAADHDIGCVWRDLLQLAAARGGTANSPG